MAGSASAQSAHTDRAGWLISDQAWGGAYVSHPGHVSGPPVGGAVGPCSCGLAPQPDCDLALALMHFPPKSSGCHCLLRLLLNSHLPSLTRPGSRGSRRDGGFLKDLTQVTEPSPPSTGKLLVALLQANCCDKLFSRVWGSFSVRFTRLRSPEFLFFLIKRWMYWDGICTH